MAPRLAPPPLGLGLLREVELIGPELRRLGTHAELSGGDGKRVRPVSVADGGGQRGDVLVEDAARFGLGGAPAVVPDGQSRRTELGLRTGHLVLEAAEQRPLRVSGLERTKMPRPCTERRRQQPGIDEPLLVRPDAPQRMPLSSLRVNMLDCGCDHLRRMGAVRWAGRAAKGSGSPAGGTHQPRGSCDGTRRCGHLVVEDKSLRMKLLHELACVFQQDARSERDVGRLAARRRRTGRSVPGWSRAGRPIPRAERQVRRAAHSRSRRAPRGQAKRFANWSSTQSSLLAPTMASRS